jgi:Family of unknown function (DUF5683)
MPIGFQFSVFSFRFSVSGSLRVYSLCKITNRQLQTTACFFIWLWMSSLMTMAQQPTAPIQLPDSLRLQKMQQVNRALVLPIADSLAKKLTDTAQAIKPKTAEVRKIIPRKATLKSLMLPGLGQAYNRQYWKIPLIYGALGAAVYTFNYNQVRLDILQNAYAEAYNSTAINPIYGTKAAYVTIGGQTALLGIQQLKQRADQFHSQRDLTIILTAAGWALQAIEANVAAHLKTFDLSDDISFRVYPTVLPTLAGGPVPGFKFIATLK